MTACAGTTSIWFCDVVRIHNLLAVPFDKLYPAPSKRSSREIFRLPEPAAYFLH